MPYQEDDQELDDELLNFDERLTRFSKYRERIFGRVKLSELPYFQVPQYSEEDLSVRERVQSRTDIPSVI